MPPIENAVSAEPSVGEPLAFDATLVEAVDCHACFCEEATAFRELQGYRFVRCQECGLVYMSPRPTAETLERLYNEQYFTSTDPRIGYPIYEADSKSLRDKSKRLLDGIERQVAPGRLLDIGCAHGFLLEEASQRGWEVQGIEPAAVVAEKTANRLQVPVHHDLFEAELSSERFDAVTLWDVIEHVPDPHRTMTEVRRLLRRRGVCSIVTPDLGSLAARFLGGRWEEMRKMPEHIYFFDRPSLSCLLSATGFQLLEWGTVGKLTPLAEAAKRMIPTSALWKPVLGLVRLLGLGQTTVYLDPRWKMSVLARVE